MRKGGIILILILLTLNLTSCYDAKEVDEQLHVLAIGIDLGISDKWRLTLQFLTVGESGGSGTGGGTPSAGSGLGKDEDILTVDAPSFFTGVNLLNSFRSRRLVFSHAQTIIFSEEVAKSGLVGEYIAPILRFKEIRRSAHVMVVKGRADEFLKENTPLLGSLVSEDLRLLVDQSLQTGFFPKVTLENLHTGLKSPFYNPIAPLAAVNDPNSFKKEGEPWGEEFKTGGAYVAGELPRLGKDKIELFGTALFRADTMVGELNGDETRYLLMARGEFTRGFFTIQDPKRPDLIIPLDVRGTKPQVTVDFEDGLTRIKLKVRLNLDLLAVQSGINYEDPDLKAFLEEYFQGIVKDGIEGVIQTCQRLNTDVFMFGNYATKRFLTIDDAEAYNWNERFQDAEVKVEVEAILRRTGRQIVI